MKIVEFEDLDLLARLGNSSLPLQGPSPRTLGVPHLSDVYKCLMIRREPERFNSGLPMDMIKVEMGLLFESMLERALAEKFGTQRPGEIFSPEGIAMSPDGVNPTLNAGEEYKLSYMSCSRGISETVIINGRPQDAPLDKFYHWFVQMMGYAKWLYVTTYILRVLFVRGDYKYRDIVGLDGKKKSFPNEPLFKNYRIEFTEQEKDANWEMLMCIACEEGII